MTNPTRITVAFDQSTAKLLEKLSQEAELRFYYENKALQDPVTRKKVRAYMDLLLGGEHIILDVDHWLLFLRFIEASALIVPRPTLAGPSEHSLLLRCLCLRVSR
jgi:hypothetical protein